MVREISGTSGSQHSPQIKRVSVRSNGAGHANADVAVAGTPPDKPAFVVKDIVSINHAPATTAKPQR